MGWLSGWQYRKSHVINSASGAGTNYQVKIIAHYGSGTDSGADFYLNGKCRTDFGDVRFTDDDGETLLDYWMESKVDSDYAVFWVEVADDLSSSNATIYIYYGKSDATTTSNGANTFLMFDDFSTDPEPDRWYDISGTYSWDNVNGIYKQTSTTDSDKVAEWKASEVAGPNYAVRTKLRMPSESGSVYNRLAGVVIRKTPFNSSSTTDCYLLIIRRNPAGYVGIGAVNDGTWRGWLAEPTSPTWNLNQWYILETRTYQTPANLKLLVDDVQRASLTDTISQDDGLTIRLLSRGVTCEYDWILVRKYVEPEPAHGSWGNEETAGGQVYEIYVDAISQSLATLAYETTYNIYKDANVTSQGLSASETTYNLLKDAISQTLATFQTESTFNISKDATGEATASLIVEVVTGVIEIFKDAIATAQMLCQTETTFNITKDALAQALASAILQSTFNIVKDVAVNALTETTYQVTFDIPLNVIVNAEALNAIQSTFNISPNAIVKVQAEVSIVKEGEIKVTKLFLVIGDLAIQIQGAP